MVQLRIEGEGLRHVELSLHDLKTKFKRHSVAAALQCSGNRRHDMIEVKKIQGLDWDIGEWRAAQVLDNQTLPKSQALCRFPPARSICFQHVT